MDLAAIQERACIGFVALLLIFFACSGFLHAQGNYEIQVCPSETVPPKTLLTELHSNYTGTAENPRSGPPRP